MLPNSKNLAEIRVLIVDDEPLAHEILLDYCASMPELKIEHQCYDASEALSYLKQHPIDLIFLDINMPKLSGLEMIKVMPSKPQIIITSAYRQYALESYELAVCDYLLKPFRLERFIQAVNKASEQLDLRQQSGPNITTNKAQDNFVTIKVDKQQLKLPLADVLYFEAFGNYVKVWTNDSRFLTLKTLSSFEDEINNSEFVRVHKSFIVNKAHIKGLEQFQLTMTNRNSVPIGKNYRQLAANLLIN